MPADQMNLPTSAAESIPAAAPAPVSSPPPAAQGQPKTSSEPLNNAFADLDRMMGEPEPTPKAKGPQPPKKPESKSTVDRPEETQPEPETGKTEEIPGDKPGKPIPAPELRKAYAAQREENKSLKAELEKLRTAKPPEDPEKKGLAEKYEFANKRLKEIEDELRLSAYERSQEFKEKWQQPFIDAYQFGRERTAQFKVTDAEGNLRQATPEDFDYVMRITDDEAAAQVAEQMFGGAKAAVILNMRNEVHRLMHLRGKALEEAQKLGGEREKIRTESEKKQKALLNETWNRLNSEAAEKYPDWFKEKDGDEKGNELLRKGYELVDKVFLGSSDVPPEQQVAMHSAIRNRAAAFGRLAYQLRAANTELAELRKELDSYKESEPKGGDGAPRTQDDDSLSWESRLEKLVG